MYKIRIVAMLLVLPILLAGCSWRGALIGLGVVGAAAAGAGAVYYAKGDLEADESSKSEVVHKAAIDVANERGWTVTDQTFENGNGVVKANMAKKQGDEDRTVTIKTSPNDTGGTHLSIRVGTFGDEALSRSIHDDVKARL